VISANFVLTEFAVRLLDILRTSPVSGSRKGSLSILRADRESQQKPISRLREKIGGFSRLIGELRKEGRRSPKTPLSAFNWACERVGQGDWLAQKALLVVERVALAEPDAR
jgi:hypothetical protein